MRRIRLRLPIAAMLGLISVLGFAAASGAQRSSESPTGIRVGVLGGASLATVVHRDDHLRITYRDGVAGGAMVALPITPTLALEAEALYVQKGAYSNFLAQDATFVQDYIEARCSSAGTCPL